VKGNNIYKYNNYRKYLNFCRTLESGGKMPYRKFSQMLGFKTDSYIIEVINRSKDLGKKSIWPVTKALCLTRNEIMYFNMMTLYADSEHSGEKKWAFAEMKRLKIGNV